MNNLHGIVFAYRSDPVLRELTANRNTSSIPFGGRYRVIDFALSNLVNAGVGDVGLIVQSNYQSLLDHVGSGKDWDLSRKRGGLRILPPFSYSGGVHGDTYHGRMEALAGVVSYLERIRQDYVVLAGGDLVLNLPLANVLTQHIDSGADITVVCSTRPQGDPSKCLYVTVGGGSRVNDVSIHPAAPVGYESLDIYILSKSLLLSLLEHCSTHGISSFGVGVLQSMIQTLKICPYFFDGFAPRLHSLSAYFQTSMALLNPAVRADLFDPGRPIRTKDRSDPSTYYSPESKAVNSLIGDGCIIEGEVEHSILFRGVRVEKGARISNSILMQGTVVRAGAITNYVIADKNVTVGAGRMLMGSDTYPMAIAKNAEV